jgi:hypothetical protein
MVILYIYSTCWHMKSMFYERQHIPQAKSEAMQEIRDNTSVDPCLDLPNELMRPYLAVPIYIMELYVKIFTLSYAVEKWNLLSVSLLLSLFLKLIGENMIL